MIKINPNEKYLIGVSGGPDSIFLLKEVLKINPKDLVVCHVNYNFRTDSSNDQKIVEDFCQKYHLKLEIKVIDKQTYQTFKENFENWARQERYAFFKAIAEKYQIFNLLIAHNQNDLIETYLLQKKRNNLVSYYGLKPVSQYQNLLVIRPMLKIKKSKILEDLKKEKISFALDSTNNDLKYERNKIRKEINENDFSRYLDEINLQNQKLRKEINKIQFYVKNHLTADELILNSWLKKSDLLTIQRVIYYYFTFLNCEQLLQNRKRKTLVEISQRIKTSRKNFWKIQFDNYFLIFDFDHLYLLEQKQLDTKKILINNQQELNQVQIFINWLDLFNAIKKDHENYPYIVTNDFNDYKTKTFYKNKRTNRYLIDHKIRYKIRFLKGVVYQKEKKDILSKIG